MHLGREVSRVVQAVSLQTLDQSEGESVTGLINSPASRQIEGKSQTCPRPSPRVRCVTCRR